MQYFDYTWDLSLNAIIPDPELNTDALGWKAGDFWQVVELPSGRKMLRRVDPMVQFTLGKHNE